MLCRDVKFDLMSLPEPCTAEAVRAGYCEACYERRVARYRVRLVELAEERKQVEAELDLLIRDS